MAVKDLDQFRLKLGHVVIAGHFFKDTALFVKLKKRCCFFLVNFEPVLYRFRSVIRTLR